MVIIMLRVVIVVESNLMAASEAAMVKSCCLIKVKEYLAKIATPALFVDPVAAMGFAEMFEGVMGTGRLLC